MRIWLCTRPCAWPLLHPGVLLIGVDSTHHTGQISLQTNNILTASWFTMHYSPGPTKHCPKHGPENGNARDDDRKVGTLLNSPACSPTPQAIFCFRLRDRHFCPWWLIGLAMDGLPIRSTRAARRLRGCASTRRVHTERTRASIERIWSIADCQGIMNASCVHSRVQEVNRQNFCSSFCEP